MPKIKCILILSIILISISCKTTKTVTNVPKNTPKLNSKVIKYINTVIGKKVDRGECWDLANRALTMHNANWNGKYVFGKLVNPKKDVIYPGDIIQYKNVKTKYKVGNTTYTQQMKHHTAIVYKVISKGVYKVAEQNTGYSGRKVGIGDFSINTMTSGTVKFYRPVYK